MFPFIMPLGQPQATPSSRDYQNLKCSRCSKYLSKAPIFISIDDKISICGRCESAVPNGGFSRNTVFENLARMMTFPCSESEKCDETLKWNDVLKHEQICKFKKFECPYTECQIKVDQPSVANHFSQGHRSNYYTTNDVEVNFMDYDDKKYSVYLIEYKTINFLLSVEEKQNKINLSVFKMTPTETEYTYSVQFSLNFGTLQIANRKTVQGYPGKYCTKDEDNSIDICSEPLKKLLGKAKIRVNIFEQKIKPKSNKKSQAYYDPYTGTGVRSFDDEEIDTPGCENFIKSAMECPVCYQPMSDQIALCTTGHSICQTCRSKVGANCPICRSTFSSGRNFALEALYLNFKTHHPNLKGNNHYNRSVGYVLCITLLIIYLLLFYYCCQCYDLTIIMSK